MHYYAFVCVIILFSGSFKFMDSTILVVEDEPEMQQLIAINLQQADTARCVQQRSGGRNADARSAAQHGAARLDASRDPRGDVCERLRGDQRTADIPIIMLTARAQEADKGRKP